MKKNKRMAGIFLIILGGIVCLLGGFLLIIQIPLTLKSTDANMMIANLILVAGIVAVTVLLGILPLYKGIKNIEKKACKIQEESPKHDYIEQKETLPAGEIPTMRTLCNDMQFDHADLSLLKVLMEMLAAGAVPIILSVYVCGMISKSVGGHIEAGSVQAWGSLFVVVLASASAMLLIYLISKYNAVGNKYFYYILDQDEGLYYTHIGRGKAANYIKNHTPVGERIKTRISLLHALLLFLYRSPGISLINLSRMESYFKINRKYRFAEEFLMKCELKQCCRKIVAVKKIKYFSKGCEAWIATMNEGIENVNKMIIYRNTSNYDVLVNKLNALYTGKEVQDYELSCEQIKQVKSNIYRRLGVFCLALLVLLVLMVLSYYMYMQANYKAQIYAPSIIKRIENMLAYRSKRRIVYIIYFIVCVLMTSFVKMLIDLVKITRFKYVPVEVVEYTETKRSAVNLLRDYNYFATVKYKGELIQVGISKKMWMREKVDVAALVLRKGVPYCLVDRY